MDLLLRRLDDDDDDTDGDNPIPTLHIPRHSHPIFLEKITYKTTHTDGTNK